MALASQAALLDELMGKNRNNVDDYNKETQWDDDEVCNYFLAGLCPHGLFTNTKADLGPCEKIHDDKLLNSYKKSSRYKKMGFEQELYRLLNQLVSDVERRIWKGQERLRLNGPSLNGGFHEERIRKLEDVTEKINDLISKAEVLGSEGKVIESQDILRQTEELKYEQNFYQKEIEMFTQQSKELEVCSICGAFRIKDDAPQRVEEHLSGKMHIGYTEVRQFLKTMSNESSRRRSTPVRRGRSRDKCDKAHRRVVFRTDSKSDRRSDRDRARQDRHKKADHKRRSRSRDRRSHRTSHQSHRR